MAGPRRDDAWRGMGTGWTITSTLIAGMAVGGVIGFLVDVAIGNRRVFAALGIVLGAAAGIYLVYLKYGRGDREDGS
jgi:F0F1-type ATP synthase assembly protein I